MPRGRPPYPDLLTPREQEVLALLGDGLTNEQIAVRLGISFGGAKYHVAEILSKLGVNSREEAARYLSRPQRSRFAVLTPFLFWKRDQNAGAAKLVLAGGIAVLVVVGVVALFTSLTDRNDDGDARDAVEGISADIGFDAQGNLVQRGPAGNLRSYYYEAKVETGPKPPPSGGHRPSAAQLPEQYPTEIRAWYEEGKGSRWDALDGSQLIYRRVADADTRRAYDGQTNTYQQYPLALESTDNADVGPLPPNGIAGLFSPYEWEAAGQEVVAGRITQIVERNVDEGVDRIWVDTEYDFVLKHESYDDMNPHRITEVTRIDYNGAVAAENLAFDLPANAREVPAVTGYISQEGTSLGPFGGTSHAVSPPGMLNLTYVPADQGAQGAGASTKPISATESMTLSYVVWYGPEASSPSTFVILQQFRAGGMTQDMRVGEAVSLRNGTGYDQSSGDEARLVFEAGDLIVTLTTTVLPLDELVKIAEGMH
jgi:DNA-binding CsgD family transcriptional regulator